MKKFKVGIQLYGVRKSMEADFEGTLKAIADMGYEYVEFAGYFDHTAEEIKAILDKYGLKCMSVHQGLSFYDENPDKFNEGESVNANHILVDTEEKALEILAKITNGEITFEDAAKEFSSCPSGQRGGNLGDFGRGQMVPEFDKAVFELEVGAITPAPVQTQFGYHLIKLNSKSESSIIPYEQIADQIKNMLLGEKRREAYERKINQLKILYPVELL